MFTFQGNARASSDVIGRLLWEAGRRALSWVTSVAPFTPAPTRRYHVFRGRVGLIMSDRIVDLATNQHQPDPPH